LAIRNFFSKSSSTGNVQRNCLRDPGEILAYLEELGRLGTVVDLQFADSDLTPVPGTVGEIHEAAGTCTIRCRYKPAKEPLPGQRVRLAFPLDKQRFLTDLGYQDRGSYLEYRFQLPSAVFHADRRDSVRARMLPHERLNILALQGLSAGLGLSGWLVDLSMGGCCFLIHRAIQIKDEQRLALTESLARQAERPRLDVRVVRGGPAVTSAANPAPERAAQFAFLTFPDAPVAPVEGYARVSGNEARAPHINVVVVGPVGVSAGQSNRPKHAETIFERIFAGPVDLADDVEGPVVQHFDTNLGIFEVAFFQRIDDFGHEFMDCQIGRFDLSDQRELHLTRAVNQELAA